MGKGKRRGKRSDQHQAQAVKQRRFGKGITIFLTIGVIAVAALFLLHRLQIRARWPAAPATKASVPAPEVEAGFDRLKGRWLRPDGGYILDIGEIDGDGKMVAGYFNPRPINVSRAEAMQEGSTTKVFVELRDINYPGSTYTLTYDPQDDQLQGVYFQAALQQSFDVVFVRMK
jgi:hypothetical protein